MQKAYDWIQSICAVPEVGQTYHGKVVSILEFGAFVEILPGKEGLLHVSEIAWNKTDNVEDVLTVGQEVDVKLLEIDPKTGKMRLSMRALTPKPEGYVEPERRPRNGGNDRGGDRRNGFDRRNGGDDRRNGDRRNGGFDRRNGDDRRGYDRGGDRRNGDDRRNGGHRNFGPKNDFNANSEDHADNLDKNTEEFF